MKVEDCAAITTSKQQVRALYDRLHEAGIPRPFLKSYVLPDWWDDEAAESPSGLAELLLHVANHTGLPVQDLRSGSPLSLVAHAGVKLKRASNADEGAVAPSRQVVAQVARLTSRGATGQVRELPAAAEIREEILGKAQVVGLAELVDFCWAAGIPVIHVANVPKVAGAKTIHGLALLHRGRPVIAVTQKKTHPAWLLFHVAHELGHIAKGHVSEGGMLVDETVDLDSDDSEEVEANAFALELLTGAANTRYRPAGRWPNADALAKSAAELSRRHGIDPGHIVLNYANSMGRNFWGVANAALKRLGFDKSGPRVIQEALADRLDWSRLPDEVSEYIGRLTDVDLSNRTGE